MPHFNGMMREDAAKMPQSCLKMREDDRRCHHFNGKMREDGRRSVLRPKPDQSDLSRPKCGGNRRIKKLSPGRRGSCFAASRPGEQLTEAGLTTTN